MKYYKDLLKNAEMYNKETLWNQMVDVNVPDKNLNNSYNYKRLVSELHYIYNKINEENVRMKIESISKEVVCNNYYVSDESLSIYEENFKELEHILKQDTIHLVSHAHIDMNWLWGYQETVDVVINTVDTMLKLMKEFPKFTFSLSQASSIKILEEFRPDLIEVLKTKIKKEQLEIIASTWVEKDTNLIDTVSFIDQITYAKKYLKQVLDLEEEDFYIDFEPDLFGHNIETSKFLDQSKIKYYYHCRGNEKNDIYIYKSQGGHEVLSYAEQKWYANSIHPTCFEHIPSILNKYDISDMIYVYGVGDHGGGPTKRDIITIEEMSNYPLFPNLVFSSYKNFFKSIETYKNRFEVVEEEMNFTLNGCFSSSTRMKYFNKHSQNIRSMTRFSQSLSNNLLNKYYTNDKFDDNIHKILFNQFHDILPGCGTIQTQEYAGGEFQNIAAYFNNIRKINYAMILDNINTDFVTKTSTNSFSGFGAGVGISPKYIRGTFGISENCYLSQNCIDDNDIRLYTCFNSSSFKRSEYVELLCWDFNVDKDYIEICDSTGNVLNHIVLESQYNQYWGHYYTKIGVLVEISPLGYECIAVYENTKNEVVQTKTISDSRINDSYIKTLVKTIDLEININPISSTIQSILYKGRKICGEVALGLNVEDANKSSAWMVGRTRKYIKQDNSYDVCFVSNKLYNEISYKTLMLDNEIEVKIKNIIGSNKIDYEINTSWDLIGNDEEIYTLQLDVEKSVKNVTSDIAGGYISRDIKNESINAINFVRVDSDFEEDLFILSENRHGYNINDDSITHFLIRSTTHPNSHPENYSHNINFSIGIASFEKCVEYGINNSNKIEILSTKHNEVGTLSPRFGIYTNTNNYINIETRVEDNTSYYYYICLEDVEVDFETYNMYYEVNKCNIFRKYDIFITKKN